MYVHVILVSPLIRFVELVTKEITETSAGSHHCRNLLLKLNYSFVNVSQNIISQIGTLK
jgi:hypothetical protein